MENNLYLTTWDIGHNGAYKSLRRKGYYDEDENLITIRFDIEKQQSLLGALFSSLNYNIYPCFCISIDYLHEQDIYLDNTRGIAFLYLTGRTQKKIKATYLILGKTCRIYPIIKNNDVYNFISANDSFSFRVSFNAEENNKRYEYEFERAFDSALERIAGIYVFYSDLLDNNDKDNLISIVNTLKSRIK